MKGTLCAMARPQSTVSEEEVQRKQEAEKEKRDTIEEEKRSPNQKGSLEVERDLNG